MSELPLQYLTGAGERVNGVIPLTWYVLIVSIIVSCVIGVLLWMGIWRGRGVAPGTDTKSVPVERSGDGLAWIHWGLVISAVPLIIAVVWTMAALGQVVGPPRRSEFTIDVTAHQWWWEVRYDDALPSAIFTTANEIHIPVGQKVVVRLHGADVIHSFWVPRISGKTDTIPGQTNVSWLEADRPGRFRGQCSEYCGLEHAQMGFEVVAESPDKFSLWRRAQLQTAPPPQAAAAQRGLAFFQYRCSLCHAIRGTSAASSYGPDLTHLMSRAQIAAGTLPNDRGSLAGWIDAPQAVKPGALMPNQHLSGDQLNDVLAYLETLK